MWSLFPYDLVFCGDLSDILSLEKLAVVGFLPASKGGGELVDYGYKGKGVKTHLLVDGNGSPINFGVTAANGEERQQVEKAFSSYRKYSLSKAQDQSIDSYL